MSSLLRFVSGLDEDGCRRAQIKPACDERRKGEEAGGSKRFAVVGLAEQASLLAGLPPDSHVAFAVGPPGGCMQTKAIDRPASPFIGQRTQVATTQQA
jgi:hypothetical protein